jgi:hypothetical protein
MAVQTDIHYEMTDTHAGEANYSWVRRGVVRCKPGEDYSDLAAVRRVKRELDLNGVRCGRAAYGWDEGGIELRPDGRAVVVFITFHSHGSAS